MTITSSSPRLEHFTEALLLIEERAKARKAEGRLVRLQGMPVSLHGGDTREAIAEARERFPSHGFALEAIVKRGPNHWRTTLRWDPDGTITSDGYSVEDGPISHGGGWWTAEKEVPPPEELADLFIGGA